MLYLSHFYCKLTLYQRNSRGEHLTGTSVGPEHIKQTISALQRYMREHQHRAKYQNSPESRIPLRNLDIVKVYEWVAAANEPARVKRAHVLKSKGTSAGV